MKLKHYPYHNLQDVPNFSRVSLLAINKYNLDNNAAILQKNLNHASNSIYFHWYCMTFDIIESSII